MRERPPGRDPVIAPVAAAALALLAFLPWSAWLPVGYRRQPSEPSVADVWNGLLLVAGVAVVLVILSRRLTFLWRPGLFAGILAAEARAPRRWTAGLALAGLALYVTVAWFVYGGAALLNDEATQLGQAYTYATGRLALPASAHPEFFAVGQFAETAGKVYGQFPAGGPAVLLLGVLLGVPWLGVPIAGAVSVLLWRAILPALEPRPGVRLGAACLFAFAPFTAFMAGSYMNHVATLTCALVAVLGLSRIAGQAAGRWGWGLCTGLGLGLAATIRPLDAVAFALPAGAWLLWRTVRAPHRWRELVASGVGVAVPLAVLFWINAQTTGHPTTFGYSVLWGAQHDPGFHAAPQNIVHTPARGLLLVHLYLLRLQVFLFETPLPALVPVVLALALARRLGALDRYLLASAALLLLAYWTYWHDGFFRGPRFIYPIVPLLALWVARCPALVRERLGAGPAYRGVAFAFLAAAVLGVAQLLPLRVRQYHQATRRALWHPAAGAEAAGVSGALVFVRESWASQLMVRMWSLGVDRNSAEHAMLYTDSCRLEEVVAGLEAEGVRGDAALARVRAVEMRPDELTIPRWARDPYVRYHKGQVYGPRCEQLVRENLRGVTFAFFPLDNLRDRRGNLFARDLHARDSLLVLAMPDRPLYLLAPRYDDPFGDPVFTPLPRDSALAAWRRGP